MTTKSTIQALCTGEPDFVVGELYGLRQWTLGVPAQDNSATLVGHYGYHWDLADVNVATCDKTVKMVWHKTTVQLSPDPDTLAVRLWEQALRFTSDHPRVIATHLHVEYSLRAGRTTQRFSCRIDLGHPDAHPTTLRLVEHLLSGPDLDLALTVGTAVSVSEHPVSHPDCTCGFYAYTTPEALRKNAQLSSTSVFGIVKAYGHVTVGTQGFRAERAEVVALTRPVIGYYGYVEDTAIASLHDKLWMPNRAPLAVECFADLDTRHLTVVDTLEDLNTLLGYYG